MSDLPTLTAQVNTLHEQYRSHFEGRSRLTRDLARLDPIIVSLGSLTDQINLLRDPGDLAALARTRMVLYRNEREEIHKLQTGGPAEVAAHRIAAWNWLNNQRYRRHFAGQSRPTRDLGLMQEMLVEQRRWRADLVELIGGQPEGWRRDLLSRLDGNLTLFTREHDAIPASRNEMKPEEQAMVWATAANTQFGLWGQHFAQKPRNTRRAALLRRMIGQLEVVVEGMTVLRDEKGIRTPMHLENIRKVNGRLDLYRNEIGQVEQSIANTTAENIARGLVSDANEQFAGYRAAFAGKPRNEVDLELLSTLCDRLHEIARAMDLLRRTWSVPNIDKNLEIVLDNLRQYEREHELVGKAKTS
jgi:hypothetical protein